MTEQAHALDKITQLTFLIVDDADNIRQAVQGQLTELGIRQIFQAENISIAKQILDKEHIGFIISDWMMPGGTGYDLLLHIRNDSRYKDTPFLLLTTVDKESNVLDAVLSGASNYLIKPWQKNELKEKIILSYNKHAVSEQ